VRVDLRQVDPGCFPDGESLAATLPLQQYSRTFLKKAMVEVLYHYSG
jgi:hypothetical protein